MTQAQDLQQGKPTRFLPQYFGIAIIIIAALVLAGWQFNIAVLASVVPGLGAMHPFVVISFFAVGLFFIVDRIQKSAVLKQVLSFGLPLIPILVGGITLFELIFNFSSPIEALLYPSKLIAFGYQNVPNHITGCTALELILTGATLFLMNFKGHRLDILINNLSGLIGIVCLLSFISCVYLIHEFHILVFITAMAIQTGVCLILSALAIMYSRPDSGLMSAFTSNYPGNRMARVFLPLSVLIPVVFGLITVRVLRHNVITTEVGMSLFFTSLIFSMFILTWYLGALINKSSIERLGAEKLRKSEFYYRSIIENASDAIMITNIRGEFSEVNSFMCELLGYTIEELLKLNIQQLIDPDQLKIDPMRFDLLTTGQTFVKDRRMVHKNGTIIEVRANVKMLPDGRILAIAHDITARKKNELQLRKSEAKFRALVENNFDAITLLDSNLKPIYRSPFGLKLTGWSYEERQQQSIYDVVHPDDEEKVKELHKKIIEHPGGEPISLSYRIKHKDGYYLWVESVIRNLFSDPDIGAIVVIYRDITERKNAEQQLAKSEAKFKALVENNFDALTLLDRNFKPIYRSPSTEKVTGWSDSDRKDNTGYEMLHPDDLEKVKEVFKKIIQNEKESFSLLYRIKHKQGYYIWVEAVTRNMLSDPDIGAIVVIFRDITERKNTELQLAKSEARFKTLVEDNFDCIVLYDAHLNIIYRSPSADRITGWTKEDLKAKNNFAKVHPDDVESAENSYKEVLNNPGKAVQNAYRLLHKNGHYIWAEFVTRNMLNDPSVGAIVSVFRDISERKNVELQLIKSEAKFKALVENDFDGITLLNSNLKAIYRSPSAERITGWSNEERKKQGYFDLIHPDDLERYKNSFKEIFDNPGKSVQNIYRIRHKDGHYIWAEFINCNMLNDASVGAIVSVFRDVSERKNAEEKLIKYNRELFMLNHVNDAIVRYKDEDALMNQTCNLLADYGSYPLAWIGFAPENGEQYKRIEPITKAGKEVKYLDSILIDQADEKMKKGPVATALATGKLKIMNHIEEEPYFEPWRELAKKHGLASLIALPFDISEKGKGVLTIFSSQPDAFDRDEVTILQRITENLAYAIRGIRIARERDLAIKQIVKSEEKYRLLFESNPLPMWMFSVPDSTIIDVNEAAIKHYGYSREEFLTMDLKNLRPAEDIDKFIKSYHHREQDGEGISNLGIWRHKKKNGEIINVEILAHDIIYEGKKVRLILVLDITEKLKSDLELQQMNEQLRQFSAHVQNAREDERTKIAREIHDELGQLLTGLKIDVSWLSKKLNSSPEELTKRVEEMLQLTDHTIQSVRRIATELRPGILDDLGLEDAIMWQATEFQNKTGIKCDVEGTLKIKKYSPEVSTAAFRILQESLTNIIRHANAKNVMIKMQENENTLHLEVIDDGSGMAHINQNGGQSLGIMGMKERASIMGGWFSITSEPFKGTRVQVEIPFKTLS